MRKIKKINYSQKMKFKQSTIFPIIEEIDCITNMLNI